MPWIEQVLQVSSDGGDGTFEFAIFFALVTVTALSTRSVRPFVGRTDFGRGRRSGDCGQTTGD
jgi:hypothetical protein